MQFCPWCAAGSRQALAQPSLRSRTTGAPLSGSSRNGDVLNGEAVIETALTSTVIGLTVQFVAFIYELTTRGGDHLSQNIAISSLAGLLAGMAAFALIRAYDQTRSSGHRCARCGVEFSR